MTANMTLRQARDRYFAASGFNTATYSDDWVDIPVGPVPFRFPNIDARKRVLPLHDLHHALTGYQATLTGEAEIGAWEVGGGVGPHWVGWYLDLLTLAWAVFLLPRRTFRAFVRGRQSENFYLAPLDPAVLDEDVGQLRARMGLDRGAPATAGDVLAYVGWALAAVFVGLLSLVLTVPAMIVLGLVGRAQGRALADAHERR